MAIEKQLESLEEAIRDLIKTLSGAKVTKATTSKDKDEGETDSGSRGRGRPKGAKNKGNRDRDADDFGDREEGEEEEEGENEEEDEGTQEEFLSLLRKLRDLGGKDEHLDECQDILKKKLKVAKATDVEDGAQAAKGIELVKAAIAKAKKNK